MISWINHLRNIRNPKYDVLWMFSGCQCVVRELGTWQFSAPDGTSVVSYLPYVIQESHFVCGASIIKLKQTVWVMAKVYFSCRDNKTLMVELSRVFLFQFELCPDYFLSPCKSITFMNIFFKNKNRNSFLLYIRIICFIKNIFWCTSVINLNDGNCIKEAVKVSCIRNSWSIGKCNL